MAPFSPLPPSHIQSKLSNGLQPPKFPLIFGQLKTSKQHDFSRSHTPSRTKSLNSKNGISIDLKNTPQSHLEVFFQGGHLSFGILLCLFIATLWLLAAFSAAQMTLSLPTPSELSFLENSISEGNKGGINEASLWGEVGMYELSGWRRIRTNENENLDSNNVEIDLEASNGRWKRNEAVLEKLKESKMAKQNINDDSRRSKQESTPLFSSLSPSFSAIPQTTTPSIQQDTSKPSLPIIPSLPTMNERDVNYATGQQLETSHPNNFKQVMAEMTDLHIPTEIPAAEDSSSAYEIDHMISTISQMNGRDIDNQALSGESQTLPSDMVSDISPEAIKERVGKDESHKEILESRRHRHQNQQDKVEYGI